MIISGIQQIGIGIPDVHEAWKWYRQNFGMDIPVFDDAGTAGLMLPYTGGKPQERHAILAINLQGGGGFEIWQYKSRTPQPPDFDIQVADLGFFAAKIKAIDIQKTYNVFTKKGLDVLGNISKDPTGNDHFFVKDPYNNIFQIVHANDWFRDEKQLTGGTCGFFVGVSNMEKSIRFYNELLNYDVTVYDKEGNFDDFAPLLGGGGKFRRVLLKQSKPNKGAFSRLFGSSRVELVQALERTPKKIFENRLWGDLGFIHVCFDINGMDELKKNCADKGYPFTVDTGEKFDMGEAAGRFAYTEDPDGALIEFVETYKVPILKKLGWFLNLQKRNPEKPLPDWVLKSFRFVRKTD